MRARWSSVIVILAAGCGASAEAPAPGARAAASPGAVVISEIMYHPVLEEAYQDAHEFVELHNRSQTAVALAGWKLAGDVRFAFPAGATLGPGQYLVVAKDRAALLAVKEYALAPESVVGDYEGELDNGKGRVALIDAAGVTVEAVEYQDRLPWPVAADALGAGERWLAPALLPLEKHRHRGHSLERLSYDHPAAEPANWDASALDGATPGRANGAKGPPRAIVQALEATVAGKQPVVKVTFSQLGTVGAAQLEWFRDDVEATGEKTAMAPLTRAGAVWEARLPAQPDEAIVRYRVWAERGGPAERVSPRPSDPFAWHALFVPRAPDPKTRTYHLFISRKAWGQLWDNLQEGPVVGCKDNPDKAKPETFCGPEHCTPSARWNATVPAVFVHDGQVYDVLARYQGSRHNRRTGPAIGAWSHAGPQSAEPMEPFRALSWSLKFPRYREFDGKDAVSLNKLTPHLCYGLDSAVAVRMYAALGIPMLAPRFVRVNVNGGYYHYMMEWRQTPETMVREFWKGEAVGDLMEAKGYLRDEGPYGISDQRRIEPYCGFTARQRYEATYDRKTNDWRGPDDLIAMIEALHRARGEGVPAMRAFFEKHWDVEKLVTYVAARNWSAAWDDSYHNHFLYQRRRDGRWLMFPWDVDNEFNGRRSTSSMRDPVSYTFYIGTEDDKDHKGVTHPITGELMWNRVKDTLLRSMRKEFNARLVELAATTLSPANVAKLVDEALGDISLPDAREAPAWSYKDAMDRTPARCDLAARAAGIKEFAAARSARIPMALRE